MRIARHHKRTMMVVLGLFSLFLMIQNGHAYQFKVGGSGDWSLATSSSSSYDQWAQKNRFQVGDTILFNYQANEDSVLRVSESDYKNCSSTSPIAKYSDGHTMIKLNQSGPHYFISGDVDHCKKNEKVVIIVLADRSNRSSDTPSPSPSETPPPALPPAPTSEEFPSPPPAPGAPEPDLTPAPAPSEDNPPPPTPNGASSVVVNFVRSFGAAVGFSILLRF